MTRAHQRLRKGRRSIGGQIYLVTFTTHERQRHFSEWGVAVDACRVLASAEVWHRSRLLAWTLMPDHWHGLVELHPQDQLPSLIGRLKGLSAHALRSAHPRLGWIWARAYHDHALRTEEDLVSAGRYIAMNAVRAGLVSRVGDYPFWDAVWVGRDAVRERTAMSSRPVQAGSATGETEHRARG
jgi:REP element-mobilizing transposase RayT